MAARRALSLVVSASTLAAALWLYTRGLSIYGPALVYPLFGAPAVAGLMALRAALTRKLRSGQVPVARAFEVMALGVVLTPCFGLVIAFCCIRGGAGGRCGILDASAAATVLGRSWPFWFVGELLVLVTLGLRRADLARLRWYQLLATTLTLIAAPPVGVLACVATMYESGNAGGSVTFLLSAALAAGSSLVAWTLRRSFTTGTALRRVVPAALVLGVPVFLVLRSRAPLPLDCDSFWTTTTWGFLADVGWAVAPFLAVMLYFARDPIPSTTERFE
jgi:hypothetical protein